MCHQEHLRRTGSLPAEDGAKVDHERRSVSASLDFLKEAYLQEILKASVIEVETDGSREDVEMSSNAHHVTQGHAHEPGRPLLKEREDDDNIIVYQSHENPSHKNHNIDHDPGGRADCPDMQEDSIAGYWNHDFEHGTGEGADFSDITPHGGEIACYMERREESEESMC